MSEIGFDITDVLRPGSQLLPAGNGNGHAADGKPLIVSLHHFINQHEDVADAVIGDTDETLLPAGGLVIVGGEGGSSKTTLTLDAIAHICSGTEWLGFPSARPVRALIIENEGPRSQFRTKLRQKTESWNGADFHHNVYVWEDPWASFNFSQPADRQHLIDFAEDRAIDLVVADPLDSLGIAGAGTPEDTRRFIAHLKDCGLHNPLKPLAFWLLHHFNKSLGRSVVAQLSGAWGGHPDAILGVELGEGQTTKLTWAKLRHATPPKDKTVILQWDTETRGFTPLDRPVAIEPEELREKVLEYVTAHPGESQSRIEEGVGGRRKAVREALEWLISEEGGFNLARGAGRVRTGKYYFPHNHAGLTPPGTGGATLGDTQPELPGTDNPARPPRLPKEGGRGEVESDAADLDELERLETLTQPAAEHELAPLGDEPEFDDVPAALLGADADIVW